LKSIQKNIVHPFEDAKTIEFFSDKSDAGLFVFGSHNKKRPNNLIIGRTFDHHILDMIEFGVENFKSMESFTQVDKPSIGSKPMTLFIGEEFEQKEQYKKFSNMMLDFLRGGESVNSFNLAGIEHLLVFTCESDKIHMRGYRIFLKKSGSKTPYTELKEVGPSMDITLRRFTLASYDLMKQATFIPKQFKEKKVKSIRKDALETTGRIHMPTQPLDQLATKKMKGFKKRKTSDSENAGGEEDDNQGNSKRIRSDEENNSDDNDE